MDQEMFEQDAQFLWADMLDEVRAKGQDDLLAWLERASPSSFDGAVMRLTTKQKWAARNLMGKYREAVEALMGEITMEHVTLEVVVDGADIAPADPAATPAVPAAPILEAQVQAPSVTEQATQAHACDNAGAPAADFGGHNDAAQPLPAEAPSPVACPEPSAVAAPAAAPLSAAALAGKAAGAGRPRIHSRILSGEVPYPSAVKNSEPSQSTAPAVKSFQPPVSTNVESSSNLSQPIPVLEDGPKQKDEVKAQTSTDFTFDTYVVGDSNIMAYRVARSVAEQPDGSLFNPVFIWGPSGNGKTHLLLAIQSYIMANQPRTRVEYISADMFITRYVDEVHVQKLRGHAVLKDMEDIDVLLVDDVQEFRNQQQETVGALFNIFNSFMLSGNKQIVLAADRAPDYLDLDPRLKTRFAQGMVQDIKAPTWEMKLSILKSFYERYRARNGMTSVRISDEAFKVMAEYGPDSPRLMTGLINGIMFNAEHDPNVITPGGIREYIDSQYNVTTIISLDKIIEAVTREYGVTYEQVTSRSRTAAIKEARQVYMWLASQLTDETYQSIGDVVGLNHSTITHGIKVINEKRNVDHTYARQLEDFKNRLCNESK